MASKYDKIVSRALKLATKPILKEGILPYKGKERMLKELEDDIRNNRTSLGSNPILPSGDEISFLERIMVERFDDVVKGYKRTFDVDEIDNDQCMVEMQSLVNECMTMEKEHHSELIELAVNMVREEYDISEDVVQINAMLIDPRDMDTSKFQENMLPRESVMEFEDHSEMESASKEVDKRRFINAMTQGAAMKTNHMYHMVGEELAELNPRLPTAYNKMMTNVDYLYLTQPSLQSAVAGGQVDVEMSTGEGSIPVINAEAVTFPVLVHEIIKGVMEIIGGHALPEDQRLAEFTMNKADYGAAELNDMQLGPKLWERFTNMIEADDFDIKHHIYAEMCSKPTEEFIYDMRDVMANTKRGKAVITEITETIREELKEDDYLEETGERGYRDLGDLLGDIDPEELM